MGRERRWLCLAFLLVNVTTLPALDSPYTIKEGETLFSIARKAQVPVDVLSAFNGISDAGKVKVGTIIHVPAAYTVKKGDTLYGIARLYAVPITKLLELNKLQKDSRIKEGDRLFIPVGTASPAQIAEQPAAKKTEPAAVPVAASSRPDPGLVWPLSGRHEPDSGKIPGLVFYGAAGDVVRSAAAGEVKWAATYWPRGKLIIIKAADGTLFSYGGNREILVNVGDRVSAGTEIARLGENPEGGDVKLYFSIRDASGHVVDPEKFFSAKS